MDKLLTLLLITLLYTACSNERGSDKQWIHSDSGSYAAAFSPDRRYVLVGDTDAPAKLWDIEQNRVLYSWQNRQKEAGTTTAVAFSGNGQVAATSEEDVVVLWQVKTGKPLHRLRLPVRIKSLALSANGDFLLLALYDRTAIYFDVVNNRVIYTFEHDGEAVNSPVNQLVNAVAISPSGKYALTGGDDYTARLWSLRTGEQLQQLKHQNAVNIVAFYPKGGFVLTGAGNGQTQLWNIKTGAKQYTLRPAIWPKQLALPDFPTFTMTTSAIAFSPDNKYLLTGHPSQRLCLWQVANGDKIDCWQAARKQMLRPGVVLQAVAFSVDGHAVYSESGNGIGQKWLLK